MEPTSPTDVSVAPEPRTFFADIYAPEDYAGSGARFGASVIDGMTIGAVLFVAGLLLKSASSLLSESVKEMVDEIYKLLSRRGLLRRVRNEVGG